MRAWGWYTEEDHAKVLGDIKRRFHHLNLLWALFLGAIMIFPSMAIEAFNIPFYIGGGMEGVLTAILSLDIIARCKLYRKSGNEKLLKIGEFHDVHSSAMIKKHLEDENVTFYMQGYYHRHLLYFFGPYIPINLMVVPDDIKRTADILERYYGGLGLVKR